MLGLKGGRAGLEIGEKLLIKFATSDSTHDTDFVYVKEDEDFNELKIL